jgi:hypothetical protein
MQHDAVAFEALIRETEPVTGSGVNLTVINMFNQALHPRLRLNAQ